MPGEGVDHPAHLPLFQPDRHLVIARQVERGHESLRIGQQPALGQPPPFAANTAPLSTVLAGTSETAAIAN